MANKERNKRSARKARAQERAAREAAQASATPAGSPKPEPTKAVAAKKEKSGKPGVFGRVRNYFAEVRTEMHRVVWPSRPELKNYSLGVIAMLFVFGVAVWLVDLGVMGILTGFASLRG